MTKIIEKLAGLAGEKKEYREMMDRVSELPRDYRFVFGKIQKYMWSHAAGDGRDMLKTQYGLIELFETGAAEGKEVTEITGQDVAGFCDELLKNVKTYKGDWHDALNRDIARKLTNTHTNTKPR